MEPAKETVTRPGMIAQIFFCAVILPPLMTACNEVFDPRAPLDQEMVVYSILSTDRDAQIVRVQQSYLPSTFDPTSYISDNSVGNAIVTLKASNGTYILHDTLLRRSDTSRYKFPLRAYAINSFIPLWGETYQVIVQSSYYGVASSSVTIPGQSTITLSPELKQVVDHPESYAPDTPMIFVVQLSGVSRGFVGRFLLYYNVLKGSRWVEERVEIPASSSDTSNYSLDYPRYPELALTPSTSQVALFYRNGYYRAVLNKVNSQYQSNRLVFKWATFVVMQADENLFDYYSSTHASLDPHSIRLDEPLVSKVNGGLGVVGAYSLDSLVNLLPGNFLGNR
jgi:hypothetical protein